MWIETCAAHCKNENNGNSFASNGECGLKQRAGAQLHGGLTNSFASNGECGLKPPAVSDAPHHPQNSFASNGECGLKHLFDQLFFRVWEIHSPAMANVD